MVLQARFFCVFFSVIKYLQACRSGRRNATARTVISAKSFHWPIKRLLCRDKLILFEIERALRDNALSLHIICKRLLDPFQLYYVYR